MTSTKELWKSVGILILSSLALGFFIVFPLYYPINELTANELRVAIILGTCAFLLTIYQLLIAIPDIFEKRKQNNTHTIPIHTTVGGL